MDSNHHHNRLLSHISRSDLDLLAPHLHVVGLELKANLEPANAEIAHCYFLTSGMASVVATGRNGNTIEIGLIGNEGVTGSAAILGSDRSPNATFMQEQGSGYRIGTGDMRQAMAQSVSLSTVLSQYVYVFMIQSAQTALINGKAGIVQRLARWLLMAQDRSMSRQLVMTHDFMALMLGVRRPGITTAVHILEGIGAIHAGRNQITVTDRKALEKAAGWTYGVPEAEYKRVFGGSGNHDADIVLDSSETSGE